MTAPVIVPLRWYGHRIDVRAELRDDQEPLFFTGDILTALNITDTDNVELLVDVEHACHMAMTLAEPALAADFMAWIRECVRTLVEPATAATATHPEPGVVELAAGGTYSVGRAARILSRDPALNFGQNTLFTAMRDSMGWITRDFEIWIPTDSALRNGWLVRHQVKIRTDRVTYPQVRITDAGMHELHHRLGGIATLNLDDSPPLALIEDI